MFSHYPSASSISFFLRLCLLVLIIPLPSLLLFPSVASSSCSHYPSPFSIIVSFCDFVFLSLSLSLLYYCFLLWLSSCSQYPSPFSIIVSLVSLFFIIPPPLYYCFLVVTLSPCSLYYPSPSTIIVSLLWYCLLALSLSIPLLN